MDHERGLTEHPAASPHARVRGGSGFDGLTAKPSVALDIEVDPLAFIARGHSLHVGIARGRYRLDLGAFAADLPSFAHGQTGFDVSFSGYGIKFDVFANTRRSGFFVGVETGLVRARIEKTDSGMGIESARVQGGLRVGYRITLPADFYITPWVGVGYAFGARDRVIDGQTFSENPLVIFPTVHLGRAF